MRHYGNNNILIIIIVILEFEPSASHMLGKRSTTRLHLKPQVGIVALWSKAITRMCFTRLSHPGSLFRAVKCQLLC